MQDLGRRYVGYVNHTYKRSGTLWEGRYKAQLIDSEALQSIMRSAKYRSWISVGKILEKELNR